VRLSVKPPVGEAVELPWDQVEGSYRSGASRMGAAAERAAYRSVDARMPVAGLHASEQRRKRLAVVLGHVPGASAGLLVDRAAAPD
jgi:hypothetical protein